MESRFPSTFDTPKTEASYPSLEATWVIGSVVLLSLVHNLLLFALPLYSIAVMSLVLPTGDLQTLAALTGAFGAAVLADLVIEQCRVSALNRASSEVALIWQNRLSRRLISVDETAAGLEQISFIRQHLGGALGLAILDAPCASIFLVALFRLNVDLGFLCIGLLVITFTVGTLSSWFSASGLRIAALGQASLRRAFAASSNFTALSGGDRRRLLKAAENAVLQSLKSVESMSRGASLVQMARVIAQAALIGGTALLVSRQAFAVGGILATTMLFARVVAPVERCSDFKTIIRIFNAARDLSQNVADTAERPLVTHVCKPILTGRASLENVTVRPALRGCAGLVNVTLEVFPGEITVVLGRSGSGKSLLAAATAGVLPFQSGTLKFDNLPAPHVDLDRQDGFLSYLPSIPMLLVASIAEIIGGDAVLDMQAVVDAALAVGVSDFIETLPQGYDTVLNTAACAIPRGRQQQILLARSLYRSPRLIILDEPTAFLDERAEFCLANALRSLSQKGSNVIVVTRSEAILAIQDRAVCLNSGELAGDYRREVIDGYVQQAGLAECRIRETSEEQWR